MIKIIEITECRGCYHSHLFPGSLQLGIKSYRYCLADSGCRNCTKTGIPKWCPLPDKSANNRYDDMADNVPHIDI